MAFYLLCLLGMNQALAGANPFLEPDESEYFKMEDDLVTVASKYAQSVNQAPNIVSVVTKDDIRARNYRTLSDVLRDLPGMGLVGHQPRHLYRTNRVGLRWFFFRTCPATLGESR